MPAFAALLDRKDGPALGRKRAGIFEKLPEKSSNSNNLGELCCTWINISSNNKIVSIAIIDVPFSIPISRHTPIIPRQQELSNPPKFQFRFKIQTSKTTIPPPDPNETNPKQARSNLSTPIWTRTLTSS